MRNALAIEKISAVIIEAGLTSLLVFCPLAFGSVHVWAYTLMEAVVCVLLIVWAVRSLLAPPQPLKKELIPLYASFALFLLVGFLQTVPLPPAMIESLSPGAHALFQKAIPGYGPNTLRALSLYPHATQVELAKFFAYFGAFFLITVELSGRKSLKRMLAALMLVGFFEAIYGLYGYFSRDYQIFGFVKPYATGPATGTFVNRNHFAGYLGMVIFMGIGYLIGKAGEASRDGVGLRQRVLGLIDSARASKGWLLLVMIVVTALAIIFSLSRMGVFSFATVVLLMIALSVKARNRPAATALVAVVTVLLMSALWYGLGPLGERYNDSLASFSECRAVIWRSTARMIGDHPLTGTGLGTYESAFQRYKPEDFKGRLAIFDHAHNDYLEMASDMGLAGFATVAFGGLYLPFVISRKRAGNSMFARGVSMGGLAAIAYLYLHSITDFNIHIPANAFTFFVIAALTINACGIRAVKKVKKRRRSSTRHREKAIEAANE